MKATLILENGSVFTGASIGSTEDRVCQLVFNTSMVGYQELLTDPACAGQGVVMSYPLVGNYGVNEEDCQSDKVWARAIVVRHLSDRGSNFRCQGDLNTYLKANNVVGIQGVDTRALTKILRNQGSMNAMLTCAEHFNIAEVMDKLKEYKVTDMVAQVTCTAPAEAASEGQPRCHAALLDLGAANSLVTALTRRGCKVTRLPANTPAQAILSGGYDGVVLSGGPGDPAENTAIIEQVKKLYEGKLPLFGFGLGHQLLALAAGAETVALPYGHRGGNIPVRDVEKGKIFITSQNHGFTVDPASVDSAVATVSHSNINDGSIEGLVYARPNCFGMQYDPEGNKGPAETEYIFDRVVAIMGGDK